MARVRPVPRAEAARDAAGTEGRFAQGAGQDASHARKGGCGEAVDREEVPYRTGEEVRPAQEEREEDEEDDEEDGEETGEEDHEADDGEEAGTEDREEAGEEDHEADDEADNEAAGAEAVCRYQHERSRVRRQARVVEQFTSQEAAAEAEVGGAKDGDEQLAGSSARLNP